MVEKTHRQYDLAAVILAAGASKRFGKSNKLHAKLESGNSVVERVFQLVSEFSFRHRVVVTSPHDTEISLLVKRYSLRNVINDNSHLGIGSSISCGVDSLIESNKPFSGIAIFLGDLPFTKPETISKLVTAFSVGNCSRITRPIYNGQAGHPVFFPRDFASELSRLGGDQGASALFSQYSNELNLVETSDSGVARDIDTPSALKETKHRKCHNAQ